jgi:dolichol kinase
MSNIKLQTELVRKGIHFCIAFVPLLANFDYTLTLYLLYFATIFYLCIEMLSLSGTKVPLFSLIVKIASRPRDEGKFVLGPVTLALGAIISLLIFSPVNAAIAIYALAFGDGISGILGRAFGRLRPRFLCGKSIEGSFSCLIAVLISTWYTTHNVSITMCAALTAAAVEALPLRDLDNIIFPLAVGIAVSLW